MTPQAATADLAGVPILRRTTQATLERLGAAPNSYSGQRAIAALAAYPRTELFWADGLGHRRILADKGVVKRAVGFVVGQPVPALH